MEPISSEFLNLLSEAAYHLVVVDPSCAAVFRTFFNDVTIVREWIDSMKFEVSHKFPYIITSSHAPTAEDFREIIQEYGYSKIHWTIYVLIMEK